MKSSTHSKWSHYVSRSGVRHILGALALVSAWAVPGLASAATLNFSLTWTNSKTPSDTFSGTLKVDSDLFPSSGVVNLTKTSATLSVTVPQLANATYTMDDLSTFSVGITKADAAKLTVGQNLMNPNVVGKVIIFGKLGSPAHKNFNQCASEFGVCFNRAGQAPIYNLTSMKVLAITR